MSPTTPLTSFGDFAISAQSAICIVIAEIIAFQDISYTTPQNRYTAIFPVSNLPSRKCFSAKDAGVGFLAGIWSTLALMPKSGGGRRKGETHGAGDVSSNDQCVWSSADKLCSESACPRTSWLSIGEDRKEETIFFSLTIFFGGLRKVESSTKLGFARKLKVWGGRVMYWYYRYSVDLKYRMECGSAKWRVEGTWLNTDCVLYCNCMISRPSQVNQRSRVTQIDVFLMELIDSKW